MIDYQNQLKLQSYLDDELTDSERREVEGWLAKDSEATALLTELRHTRGALTGFENEVRLPESREFFWSKIQREIQRQEATAAPPPVSTHAWVARLRRLLIPCTGLALIGLLAMVVTHQTGSASSDASAETALEDSGAFTYHDFSAGATLVWLSYPADNEIADNDDLDSLD